MSLVGNAQQLHTESNAASMDNESNAVTGWSPYNSNVTSVSVESNDVYSGSYALRIETVSDGSSRGTYSFPTTVNTQYKIVIYAKKNSSDAGFWAWVGFSDFTGVDMVGTDWQRYEFNLTADSSSALIKVYAGAPSIIGDAVLIDQISIQELDSSVPIAPALSEISHTDESVNLSWSGATDNIGVTGYNVYRDGSLEESLSDVLVYQVVGLSPSTEYSFTVTAVDAAGNESALSNPVSVTTSTASSGGSVWSESGNVASYAGNVAIGTTTVPNGYKMAMDGKLIVEEIKVQLNDNWPDYVFAQEYDLPTLKEIRKYIEEEGHLPNIPSAEQVKSDGIQLGEMNRLLLEKIEELTLHILDQQQQIDQLLSEIKDLK